MAMTVSAIDHIVLTVRDIERTLNFYEVALGMKRVEFKPGRFALTFGEQKINLHEAGAVVDKNVRHATPGSADLCLLTTTLLSEAIQHLRSQGVKIIQGPVCASGARSPLSSIYFYDPDENLIEVSNEVSHFGAQPLINAYTSMKQPIDTHAIKATHEESWYAQELAEMSGAHLRFRIMRDTSAEFHKHVEGPECFFVLSGEVQLDTEYGSVTLLPGQFCKVDASVSHRTRVKGEATLLVVDQLTS